MTFPMSATKPHTLQVWRMMVLLLCCWVPLSLVLAAPSITNASPIVLSRSALLEDFGDNRAQRPSEVSSSARVWRRYTVNEGLPQNSVVAITEDVQGFIWMATYGGLVRFDGHSFERFGLSEGFASERFTALYADQDARLWIGTEDSGLYWWANGQLQRAAFCNQRCGINHIAQDQHHRIYVASANGLYMLAADGDPSQPAAWRSLSPFANHIVHSVAIANGSIAVGRGHELWLGKTQSLQFAHLADAPDRQSFIRLRALEDDIFVLAGRSLLHLIDDQLQQVMLLEAGQSAVSVVRHQGATWLGVSPGGLLRISDQNAAEALPIERADWPQTLLSDLYVDRNGDFWIGSNSSGVLRSRPRHVESLGGLDLPLARPVMAVVNDQRGGLLVGLVCGGVYRYTKGQWLSVLGNDPNFSCVFGLLPESNDDDALYIAASSKSILKLSGANGSERRLLPLAGKSEAITIRGVFRDRRGRLWAGAQDGLYLEQANVFVRLADSPNTVINAMGELSDGRMWLASGDGVYLSGTDVAAKFTRIDGPAMPGARALLELASNDWLIGTYGAGLFRVTDGRVQQFHTGLGLHENFSSCLLRDQNDLIWSSGNRGISLIPLAQLNQFQHASSDQDLALNPTLLNQDDGMTAAETNGGTQNSCARMPDGRFVFTTIDGLAFVNPASFSAHLPTQPIFFAVGSSRNWLASGQSAVVPTDTGFMELRFSVPDFRAGSTLRFRHRLTSAGFRQPWTTSTSSRSVQLNALPYGLSQFDVQVDGASGLRQTASIQLFRGKPWYLHPLALAIASIAALLIVSLLVRRRINALKRNAVTLEQTVQMRTQALSQALAEVETLAMTDSLTGLANHRALMQTLESVTQDHKNANAANKNWALALLDVDQFKLYNDHFGHPAGDVLLQRVASWLRTLPGLQCVARQGGDEFALLFSEADYDNIERALAELCSSAKASAIAHAPNARLSQVSLSIGAIYIDQATSAELALKLADQALYQVKQRGGSGFCLQRG
jgi:diguanylate cyclase (GGDEF)-like protein